MLQQIKKRWQNLPKVGKICQNVTKIIKSSQRLEKFTKRKGINSCKLYQKKPIGTKSEEEKNDQKQTV